MYSHGFLKVAAASPVARVGDPLFNVKEMLKVLNTIEEKKPSIICFPEMGIPGYSIGDLIFQKYLYEDSLEAINYFLKNNNYDGVVIFGSYIIINDAIYNCCFVSQKNKILGIVPKNFLPHTNEFYESRWFASGSMISKEVKSVNLFGETIPFGKIIFENRLYDVTFGAEICADMWAPMSPSETLFSNGALMVFNPSASPICIGKSDYRRMLTKTMSFKFNGAYIYASNNASESTSEVVFSGHKIIAEAGSIISEDEKISLDSSVIYGDIDIDKLHYLRRNNSYYKSSQDMTRDIDILKVSFDLTYLNDEFHFEKELDKFPFVPKVKREFEEIINIQIASVIKRLEYIGIKKVVLGVSGGLDSTLALLSLCYAFDKYGYDRKNILGFTMPSFATSANTLNNSLELMKKLNITYKEIPIHDMVSSQLDVIGQNRENKDTTYENVQARYRTLTLMNIANKEKAIVIGTGDMSEIALGWSTFNGDHMAMYAINAGLPKTVVKEVVNYYCDVYPEVSSVIKRILETPITPELASSSQSTEDIIGKYEINDFILYHFLVNGDTSDRIEYLLQRVMNLDNDVAKEYVYNFNKRFYSQQYKRLTAPESVKILDISLSPRTEIRLNGDIYYSREKKNR